jgi:plastocyanin
LVLRRASAGLGVCALAGAALLPASATHGGAASAASIYGRVELRRDPPPLIGRPQAGPPGLPALPEGVDRRQVVVYLDEAPRPAFDEPEGTSVVLDQRRETFVPHVLAITVGTKVDFLNSDRMYHNVFSLSKAKKFDLGRYPSGQKASVTFDRPGVVRVFCELHSQMSAFILVFAHRYFAVTQPDGSYRLADVPPGSYTVVAWHEGEARAMRTVEVRPNENVELDFQIR